MAQQYKRILLKLSGESLMGKKQYGIDEVRLQEYAAQIKEIAALGIEIAIVIGGGNIFRGLSGASRGFDRVKGDQMGMLATVINSLASHRRTLQPGPRHRIARTGRNRHYLGRNGKSVLYDRYCFGLAGYRGRGRCYA